MPLRARALFDAAEANNAVVEALVAKGGPTLQKREATARSEGETRGMAKQQDLPEVQADDRRDELQPADAERRPHVAQGLLGVLQPAAASEDLGLHPAQPQQVQRIVREFLAQSALEQQLARLAILFRIRQRSAKRRLC